MQGQIDSLGEALEAKRDDLLAMKQLQTQIRKCVFVLHPPKTAQLLSC